MSCNCCCANVLDFCKQDICDEIDFDILALLQGEHKMVTYFLGIKTTISQTFEVGDKIVFPLENLNENFMYTAELYDPEGNRIVIKKDEISYDCFKFRTTINIAYVLNS